MFIQGEEIVTTIQHLRSVEQFVNSFIAVLNISLMERLTTN